MDYSGPSNFVSNPDRYYYFSFPIFPGQPVLDAVEATVRREKTFEPKVYPDTSGVQMSGGRRVYVEDKTNEFARLNAVENEQGFSIFKAVLPLILGGIEWVSSAKDNQREERTQGETVSAEDVAFTESLFYKPLLYVMRSGYGFDDQATANNLLKKVAASANVTSLSTVNYNHWLEIIPRMEEEELVEMFEAYVAEADEMGEAVIPVGVEPDFQIGFATHLWRGLLDEEKYGDFMTLFIFGYMNLMKRLRSRDESGTIEPFEMEMLRTLEELPQCDQVRGRDIFEHLTGVSVSTPEAAVAGNLLNKTLAWISHEMVGQMLRLPFANIAIGGRTNT